MDALPVVRVGKPLSILLKRVEGNSLALLSVTMQRRACARYLPVRNTFFSPEEIDPLEIPVVNTYAIHPGCPSMCAGGAHCHADFILNLREAAADLFRIVFPNEPDQEASR